jgi:DNA-directed RNA polymerase specialized sigma24 family protein
VREAWQQIPTEQRTVIELAFWGGMTHREIALHVTLPSAPSRLACVSACRN